jgi:hypothetical protein
MGRSAYARVTLIGFSSPVGVPCLCANYHACVCVCVCVCALGGAVQLDVDTMDIVNTYTFVANLTAANAVRPTLPPSPGVHASIYVFVCLTVSLCAYVYAGALLTVHVCILLIGRAHVLARVEWPAGLVPGVHGRGDV